MKYIVTLNGNQYEVDVDKGQATASLLGEAPAYTPTAAPVAPATTPAAPAAPTAVATDSEVVEAPMPGKIFEVKCAAGQSVKAGDALFVLEAMKMENEICAPRDGVVKAVYVKKGDTVETDAPLCAL